MAVAAVPRAPHALPELPSRLGGRDGHDVADDFVSRYARVRDRKRAILDVLVAVGRKAPSALPVTIGGGEHPPAAHAAREHLDDDVVLRGVLPRHGNLLQLALGLEERPGGIRIGVREGLGHVQKLREKQEAR